jgi:hypothetical protein
MAKMKNYKKVNPPYVVIGLSAGDMILLIGCLDQRINSLLKLPVVSSHGWIPPQVQQIRDLQTRLFNVKGE